MGCCVLVVDDSEAIRAEVERILLDSHLCDDVLVADGGLAGLRMVMEHPVDLVLCDFVMPDIDGLKFLGLLNSRAEDSIPVIMLTSQSAVEEKVKCLDAGATDYLTKPFHADELLARVRVHLNNKALRGQLRSQATRVRDTGQADPLTGVASRQSLMADLESELARGQRHNHPVAMVLVSLKGIAEINEKFGPSVGDGALQQAVRALRACVRLTDRLARYGGASFACLLPETDAEGARQVADKCERAIADLPIRDAGELRLSTNIATGVAEAGSKTPVGAFVGGLEANLYRQRRG